jgi:hypothetical protein
MDYNEEDEKTDKTKGDNEKEDKPVDEPTNKMTSDIEE